ncbi:MAG: hypothetical protein MK110_06520 [Fuerstiella sp.]|nr:hypothetical protein [Fuerstiella sp.]
MAILNSGLKSLFVVALLIGPANADVKSIPLPPEAPVRNVDIDSADAQGTNIQPVLKRSAADTQSANPAGPFFFSHGRPAATDAPLKVKTKSDMQRPRMHITVKPTLETPLQSPPKIAPERKNIGTGSPVIPLPTTARSSSGHSSLIQQVAGQSDETYLDFSQVEETPDVSIDESDLPEFRISEEATETTFAIEDDSRHEEQDSVESTLNLNTEPPHFDVTDPQPEHAFDQSDSDDTKTFQRDEDSTSNSVLSAVPDSSINSLPSEHTGAQQPTVEVVWQLKGTLNIGQKSQCSLIVTNTGSSLVRNVTVEAAIPDGVDVLSAFPVPHKTTSRWSVGDLNAGESRSIEMVVVPRKPGNIPFNAFVRFTGYSTSVLTVQEPMLRMAVQGPDSVNVGDQAGYKIRVENPGSGTAHNVVIEAHVPDGMLHRSGSIPRIHVGTLNPGDSRQALLNLTALDGGTYRLAVRAVADGNLSDEARTEIRIARPSLAISMNGPKTADIGTPINYEVIVKNTGDVPSTNVRAKYRIPNDARFVKADRGGVHQSGEQIIDWFVGTIQPGESTRYQVTLKPGAPGTAVHRAGVKSENTSVTMVSHTTLISGVPDLLLNVDTADAVSIVGEETIVRIRLRNEGSADAEKVGVICELPSGLKFEAADGPVDFLTQNGVVMFRSVDAVETGSEITYLIKGKCLRPGRHHVRVRVGSQSLSDPVIGEGTVNAGNVR